jgi:hypothetical protein
MKKTILLSLLILVVLAGTVFAEAIIWPEFPDVEDGSYYEDAVYRMQRLEVISGYSDGTFGPNDNITRGQVATILDRYNENVVKPLQMEVSYLKSIVCADEPDETDPTEERNIWDVLCMSVMETQ